MSLRKFLYRCLWAALAVVAVFVVSDVEFIVSVSGAMIVDESTDEPVQPDPLAQASAKAAVPDEAGDSITFVKMESDVARTRVLSWLASTGQNAETLKPVMTKWANDTALAELAGDELLDLCVASFAVADRATQRLVQETYGEGPIDLLLYDGIRADSFFENQVRHVHGRWLVQHRYYDDAFVQLNDLSPEDAVDPAGLLFYKAVCQAELLKRKDALETLSLLLNNTQDVPHRFLVISRIMMQELAAQSDEGMELVERLMKDVERRLELGESGKDTQEQGEAIVSAIDKMLEEMEKKKNQQQGGGQGQGENSQQQPGQQAADQSRIKGEPADGIADRKNVKEEGAWGMLDKKAEAKAKELIRGKLPSNFLDQIGRFSKKLAEQK